MKRIALLSLIAFFQAAHCQAQDLTDIRIGRALKGLRPPVIVKNRPLVRWTLEQRMKDLHVPGVSIAIIEESTIVWAAGFGLKMAGTLDSVRESTLFQAQSISKPIAATAMLRLVENNGLSLDDDVNRYLNSWRVPTNDHVVKEMVTLRRILSHSAGFTVSGFPGYRLGDSIPTPLQIFNGQAPANTPAIQVDTIPGTMSRYSGGGYFVLQQLLVDIADESFPTLMKRLVFDPIGMTLSTYEQPLPHSRWNEAAVGHDATGFAMKGKWPIQPEMAAAGLWTTPTELAKWAIEISNAWNTRPNRLLTPTMAREMLTVQKEPFGLGLLLSGDNAEFNFGHSGANLGFRAEFVMYPSTGDGAVVMTNADLGSYLIREIFQGIAAEFNWPGRRQTEREAMILSDRQIEKLVGTYTTPGPFGTPVVYKISREADRLFAELEGFSPKVEIFAQSADTLFSVTGYTVAVSRDSTDRAIRVNLGGQVEAVRE